MSKRAGITFTKLELEYIKSHYEKSTPEEIAQHLDRSISSVKFQVDKIKASSAPKVTFVAPEPKGDELNETPLSEIHQPAIDSPASTDLKSSIEYQNLLDQFDESELEYFDARYQQMIQQFEREGLLSTENVQVFQLIKYEILMNRNLKMKKSVEKELEKLKEILAEAEALDDDSPTHRQYVIQLLQQVSARDSSLVSRTGEYVKLQEKHKEITRELKAARDQRIKNLENSKIDFVAVLKNLNDPIAREKMGRDAELSVMAASKELQRLTNSHKYNDGSWDQPLLNATTVLTGDGVYSEETQNSTGISNGN